MQLPWVYVRPAPVYMPHRAVYLAPRQAYAEPQPIHARAPGRHGHYDRHYWEHRGPHGDLDRDGIPNQYDRDRDGDGVRNRYDHQPSNPYRN